MTPKAPKGYLLGIGSNLSPEDNIAAIVEALIQRFSTVTVSRVLSIPPVGMNSQFYFLNLICYIETTLSVEQLKSFCNNLETELGRDRTDPNSKTKDRTADLDILLTVYQESDLEVPASQMTDEYFLYPLIDEICAYLAEKTITLNQKGVSIQLNSSTFGETAATIHRNTTSS